MRIFTDDERRRMACKEAITSQLPCLPMAAERAVHLAREHGLVLWNPDDYDSCIEVEREMERAEGRAPATEMLVADTLNCDIYAVNTEGFDYPRYAARLADDAAEAVVAWAKGEAR